MSQPADDATVSGRGRPRFQYWLRGLLVVAATLVIVGWTMYLTAHGHERFDFREEFPARDATVLARLADAFRDPDGLSLMLAGIVVLVLTPMTRVAVTLVGFARERDRVFVLLSGIVLLILIYGMFLSR